MLGVFFNDENSQNLPVQITRFNSLKRKTVTPYKQKEQWHKIAFEY